LKTGQLTEAYYMTRFLLKTGALQGVPTDQIITHWITGEPIPPR
jgi:hypothetical protein